MGDFEIEVSSRLMKLETQMSNIESRLEDVSDIKEAIVKLTLLQEIQVTTNSSVSNTLKEMKTNLYNLGDKVNELEVQIENSQGEDKNKVELSKAKLVLIGTIVAGIFTSVGAIIVALIK